MDFARRRGTRRLNERCSATESLQRGERYGRVSRFSLTRKKLAKVADRTWYFVDRRHARVRSTLDFRRGRAGRFVAECSENHVELFAGASSRLIFLYVCNFSSHTLTTDFLTDT